MASKMTIALVGNGGCLLDNQQGKEIDSHDLVMRINNFVIMPKFTGVKTTNWVTSFHHDIQDRKGNFPVWCPFPLLDEYWRERYCNTNQQLFDKYRPICQPTESFFRLIRHVENPSTGLAMLWWLKEMGELPTLYGFSFFQGRHHYFDNKTICGHNGSQEQKLVEKIYGKLG